MVLHVGPKTYIVGFLIKYLKAYMPRNFSSIEKNLYIPGIFNDLYKGMYATYKPTNMQWPL